MGSFVTLGTLPKILSKKKRIVKGYLPQRGSRMPHAHATSASFAVQATHGQAQMRLLDGGQLETFVMPRHEKHPKDWIDVQPLGCFHP
ncbi:MAG: hypothetical protein WBF88_02880 [Pusillimonas sp.]